jgi:hypothetical protein
VDIVKEVALRTADGHWPKSFIIGDEAEERYATACEAIADLGRQLQSTRDTIIGEHCEDILKALAYYSLFLARQRGLSKN